MTSPAAAAAPTRPPLHLPAEAMAAEMGFVPSLDGLRAASIAMVLVGHLVSERMAPGAFGVSVFFAISGFLISRLLLAEWKRDGRVSLPRFYVRRMLRLYPVLLAYVATVVAFSLASGVRFHAAEPFAVLGYVANYYYLWFEQHYAGQAALPFGIFWSLAVEEHFYLLFPPLLVVLRGRPRALLVAMAAVCLAGLLLRLGAAAVRPDWIGDALRTRSEFRLDSIAYGVLLSAALELASGRAWVRRLGGPAAFAAAVAVLAATFLWRDEAFRETWRYSLQGLALMVVFAGLLFDRRYALFQAVLNWGPVSWVGRLSYSLYVWHLVTPTITQTLTPQLAAPLQSALQVALSFALAAASYYGLERPALRARRLVEPWFLRPKPRAARAPSPA